MSCGAWHAANIIRTSCKSPSSHPVRHILSKCRAEPSQIPRSPSRGLNALLKAACTRRCRSWCRTRRRWRNFAGFRRRVCSGTAIWPSQRATEIIAFATCLRPLLRTPTGKTVSLYLIICLSFLLPVSLLLPVSFSLPGSLVT
jgi:hypothetical protein